MTTVQQPAENLAWYALSPEAAAGQMGVDPDDGLDPHEAKRRLEEYSHKPDGVVYAVDGCPFHQHPFDLIPPDVREQEGIYWHEEAVPCPRRNDGLLGLLESSTLWRFSMAARRWPAQPLAATRPIPRQMTGREMSVQRLVGVLVPSLRVGLSIALLSGVALG